MDRNKQTKEIEIESALRLDSSQCVLFLNTTPEVILFTLYTIVLKGERALKTAIHYDLLFLLVDCF